MTGCQFLEDLSSPIRWKVSLKLRPLIGCPSKFGQRLVGFTVRHISIQRKQWSEAGSNRRTCNASRNNFRTVPAIILAGNLVRC